MSEPAYVSRADFQALLLTVEGLQRRVSILEGQGTTSAAASVSSFELVVPEPGTGSAAAVAEAASALSSERLQASRLIGAWIKRCLRSEPRGLSGREKIALASKFYVVVHGFDLVIYNPPKVFASWSEAKALTHHLGQPGDSIFVGVPSRAEVRAVLAAAELEIPAAFRQ